LAWLVLPQAAMMLKNFHWLIWQMPWWWKYSRWTESGHTPDKTPEWDFL
jgi:hypothetical protein